MFGKSDSSSREPLLTPPPPPHHPHLSLLKRSSESLEDEDEEEEEDDNGVADEDVGGKRAPPPARAAARTRTPPNTMAERSSGLWREEAHWSSFRIEALRFAYGSIPTSVLEPVNPSRSTSSRSSGRTIPGGGVGSLLPPWHQPVPPPIGGRFSSDWRSGRGSEANEGEMVGGERSSLAAPPPRRLRWGFESGRGAVETGGTVAVCKGGTRKIRRDAEATAMANGGDLAEARTTLSLALADRDEMEFELLRLREAKGSRDAR